MMYLLFSFSQTVLFFWKFFLLYTFNIKRLLLDNTRYGYAINIFPNNVVLTLK